MSINNIVIIGSGNLGWNLTIALFKAGFNILQIIDKNIQSANKLASQVNSDYTDNIKNINRNADLYIISVFDAVIENVVNSIKWNNKLVVHTSGSTNISIFKKNTDNYGVIYPLQTFTKFKQINFSNIPVFIEANNKENENQLLKFISKISNIVRLASSQKRFIIHLSAIVANNFTNYLYTLTDELLKKQGISFNILEPLFKETLNKAIEIGPSKSQTGPAIRNDINIIEKHLDFLKDKQEFYNIYTLISENIINRYNSV